MLLRPPIELLGREKQGLRRQRGPLRVSLDQAVTLPRVLPEALEGRLQLAVQHHRRLRADVVEYRGGVFEKEGQVILDAGGGDAVADVLVDAALGRVALEQLAPALAKARAGVVVHRELAARQQAHLGHRVQAALAVRIEGADGVDLVVEQVHPQRHAGAHREQIDQAAAHRVFAGADDLGDMAVSRQCQLGLEPGFLELLLDPEMEGVAGQEGGRRDTVERGGGRNEHHVRLALRNTPESGQALTDEVLVRRKRVVGQGFPVREQGAAQTGREKCNLVDQALRVRGVGRDDGGELAPGLGPHRHRREQ